MVTGRDGGSSKPIRNADLYVNLGNAALGAERLGPAVLAYRRALALDPNHHRAEQNLEHARTLLPDWVPRPERGGLLTTFFAWVGRLSTNELQTLAVLTFFVAVALVACAIRWRQPTFRNLAVIPGIVWLMLLSVSLSRSFGRADDAAVVIVPETIARSADSAGAPARLPQPLPSGTEVRVVENGLQTAQVSLVGRVPATPEEQERVGNPAKGCGQGRTQGIGKARNYMPHPTRIDYPCRRMPLPPSAVSFYFFYLSNSYVPTSRRHRYCRGMATSDIKKTLHKP